MGSTELDEPRGAHGHCYDILLVSRRHRVELVLMC